ncbi:uncharacterized protein L969DRAFT_97110 [Mixia osmundae IAM 14324]|uniref:Adenylate kinase isoenzyme 6 homolog n=1 Tax=Mixia osmundae (strain CBS 9802 / IAM 14324 / JCM 22182 / KY 12970) TaxID=764103 RepID=G7E1Q2_MIXOS|nr:uncharacterized protein L969DRAFT_97110 [Mixia osmundae IAM 14324]KEI36712.1 hypothetical protein L969DRAFT_97110 [Mixia osmundae IAM 14324]GAA96762.1 hypothetical protein E5Q_03433 [Mixia osmundae IAM 14324]
MADDRKLPNVLITGTPGTGKTSHAATLLDELVQKHEGFRHINVGEFVKEHGCHEGWNEEWQSYDVDEDKLLDQLEAIQTRGGIIFDWHTCDVFPERWIDLVVVLRCEHTKLWERLEKRKYSLAKIQENNTAEIMMTVLEEARAAYADEIVVELQSDGPEEMESNPSVKTSASIWAFTSFDKTHCAGVAAIIAMSEPLTRRIDQSLSSSNDIGRNCARVQLLEPMLGLLHSRQCAQQSGTLQLAEAMLSCVIEWPPDDDLAPVASKDGCAHTFAPL